MGLFGNNYKKQYDYEENGLIPKFNILTKKYDLYISGPYEIIATKDELNRRSKKYLKELNKKLHNDKELFNQELEKAQAIEEKKNKIRARDDKLRELGYRCDSFEIRGITPGSIDKDTENYLLPIVSEEKALVGIHRTPVSSIDTINDIFENGFTMSGGIVSPLHTVSLGENFGYYADNMKILDQVKYASGYKNSNGSFLIRIPDEELKDSQIFNEIKRIINTTRIVDGQVIPEKGEYITRTLKREYILGYAPTDKDFNAGKIILNPYSTYNKQLFEKNNNLENVVNNDKTTEVLANELIAKEEKLETTQELKIR